MCMVDRIRELANGMNMSITAVEGALGFGNGTIGKWTKQSPTCDKLKKVADYLGTSVDYILSGEEAQKTPALEISENGREMLRYFESLPERDQILLIGEARGLQLATVGTRNPGVSSGEKAV
ncbi:MAG: XRE family transcriptional regulator [Provencibacterium sp.]|nr:XRE family transcriptional regulator [Provencibacterium sp.]